MTPTPIDSPVVYPTITAGGRQYQLRFAHAAWFQLQAWNYQMGDEKHPIPILALAAAAAGEVNQATGKWKTAGFASPLEFADAMLPGETLASLAEPVLQALGKAAPGATLTLETPPAEDQPAN